MSNTISPEQYRELSTKKSKNKYGAVRKTYKGISYDSTGEANYAAELDLKMKIGEVYKWERQVPIEININGILWTVWKADFKVWITPDTYEIHEFKGMETRDFKLIWKAIQILKEEQYPNVKFKLIKK